MSRSYSFCLKNAGLSKVLSGLKAMPEDGGSLAGDGEVGASPEDGVRPPTVDPALEPATATESAFSDIMQEQPPLDKDEPGTRGNAARFKPA